MNDLTPEQWDQLRTKIDSAARRVSSQWPDTVEREDLAQEMVLRLLEAPGALSRISTEDNQTTGAFLIKIGHQIASAMQQDYDQFSGNHLYDVAEVRGLLDRGAISETEPKRFRAEILDIQEALGNLAGGKHYAEIVNRYVHEITPDRMNKAGHNRVTRAVEALTAAMNRIGSERRKNRIEGPGSRKAISNSTAIVITRQHTNGDYSGSSGARNL